MIQHKALGRRWPSCRYWTYLGPDFKQREWIRKRVLSHSEFVDVYDAVQKRAGELRSHWIDVVGDLGIRYDSLEWWASSLADKNPEESSVFLELCHLFVATELQHAHSREGILFVVENRGLRNQVRETLAGAVPRFRWHVRIENVFLVFFSLVWAILSRFVFVCRDILPLMLLNLLSTRSSPEAEVLFFAYWPASVPAEKASLVYFGGLSEWLAKKGRRTVSILYRPLAFAELAAIRATHARSDVLLPWEFLAPIDVIRGIAAGLRAARIPEKSTLNVGGRRLNQILIEEQFRQLRSLSATRRLLLFFALKRMGSAFRKAESFIYPYENLSIEKAICSAIRSSFPKVRLIGFQHSTVRPMLLNYFPSKAEWSRLPRPDLIVCSGEAFAKMLLDNGYPKDLVTVGSSLRFIVRDATVHRVRRVSGEGHGIVALPISAAETHELVSKMLSALEEVSNFRITFKLHPAGNYDSRLIRSLARAEASTPGSGKPSWAIAGDYSLTVLMGAADILIYSASSSAIFDAMSCGLPALRVLQDSSIDLKPLESDMQLTGVREARHYTDIAASIGILLRMNDPSRQKYEAEAKRVLSELFAPISESGLTKFLVC